MTDDELEARLRDALAARDPGTPAPDSLRDRVAGVPSTRAGIRSPLAARTARAAATILATAAAVVVGIVGVSSLRTIGPGSSALPSAASDAPNPTPDLHAAGFVLAVPIWLIVGVVVISVAAVGILLEPTSFSVPGLVARPPRWFGWIARPVPRRLAIAAIIALAIATGFAGSNATALVRGSSWGPTTAHYMGFMRGYPPNRSIEFFRYEAGTTIAFDQTIRNAAPLPVTILGGDPMRPWLELRVFDHTNDSTIFAPDMTPSFPFVPFELGPNEERQVLFVWHLAPDSPHCHADGVIPSPEPTPGSGDTFVPPSGGTTTLDRFSLRYSVLGFERTDEIELDPIVALWSSGNTTCGFDFDWASPKPSLAP